jgi:hypothetical protein
VLRGLSVWAWRTLLPLVAGHALSMTLVAGAVMRGLPMNRTAMLLVAGVLLGILAIVHASGRGVSWHRHAGRIGLALCSFMMATVHGAGLVLVPALIPLCTSASGTTGSSSPLVMALAMVGVHMAAMPVAIGVVSGGACRAWAAIMSKRR